MNKLCAAGVLLAACSTDPTLSVNVHHPSGFTVAQTLVTVYFGGDINCDQIELGDRTDAELAAITVDEVDPSQGDAIQVSRLGGKSIVARGYDDQHQFVTAGCQDVGEIAGATHIEIDTQPTAVVAVDPGSPDLPFTGRSILVTMTDIHGAPLDGNVSWLMTGPAGSPQQQPAAGVTTKKGEAKISVDDLGMLGPEALRLRAPWTTAPLPLVTGFDLTTPIQLQLGGGTATSHPSCEVRGHAGQLATLVCLTQADGGGHRDAIELSWNGTTYAPTPITIPSPVDKTADNQFALFVDHDGSTDEPVFVVSASPAGTGNWYKLGAAGTGRAESFGGPVQSVVYIPRCSDNTTIALVGVETAPPLQQNSVQLYTPAGIAVGSAFAGEIFSGGCVDDAAGSEHQAMVVANSAGGDAGLVLVTNTGTSQVPIASGKLTGSGFVVASSAGTTEKRFAGTRLQASGTVVFQAVLAPEGNSYKLVERSEVDAAAPPTKIIGGLLDQDNETDLMWDMANGLRKRLFQVSLAKQVSGEPLTAVTSGTTTPATATTVPTDFLAGELNGKPTDEIVLFTQSTVSIYSANP